MDKLISEQAAIDIVEFECGEWSGLAKTIVKAIEQLPSAQSDIIRCNACKHWTQTTGNMPGFGLGDCDYLNAKLVNCNGYCYWAERREE